MYPYMLQQPMGINRPARSNAAMAVNPVEGYNSFNSYLRASINGNPGFTVNSSQPKPRLHFPYTPMALQQREESTSCTRSPVDVTAHQHYQARQIQPSPHFAATEQNTSIYFDEAISHLEALPASFKEDTAMPMFPQAMPAQFSFCPLEPSQTVSPASIFPPSGKMDDYPEIPVAGVMTNDVDLSKYEPVPFDDWVHAPIEYGALSPASVDTDWSALRTPSTYDGDSFVDSTFMRQYSATQGFLAGARFNHAPNMSFAAGSSFSSTNTACDSSFDDREGHSPSSFDNSFSLLRVNSMDQEHFTGVRSTSPQSTENPVSPQSDEEADASLSLSPSSIEPEDLTERTLISRQQRDDYLLKMRAQRYSFKEIKRLGRFTVAESTLRGRYRVLTKDKSERVRQPKWNKNDVKLLRAGVEEFSDGVDVYSRTRVGRHKMPWKKVSEWMNEHGSSYFFAPSTCAKKWSEVGKR